MNMSLSRSLSSDRALSLDDMRRIAPSIFATQAHSSRSERFAYVPTIQVVEALIKEGFLPYSAKQSSARSDDKRDYTKHMIRFREVSRVGDWTKRTLGQAIPEVILINAHDGSSRYKLMGGVFRLICLNGMVVSEGTVETVNVRHSGKIEQEVLEGTFRVLGQTEKTIAAIEGWSQVQLQQAEREALAAAAHELRFPRDEEGNSPTAIRPEQLLETRRFGDQKNDLWTTFNVVQENCTKGGLHARAPRQMGQRRGRMQTTRDINGIDQDVKLNRALWVLAEKMAEIKQAA